MKKSSASALLVCCLLVSASCVSTPKGYLADGYPKVWSTGVKKFGTTRQFSGDQFTHVTGTTLAPTYSFYSAKDGTLLQTLTSKQLDAMEKDSGKTALGKGIYSGYRGIQRLGDDGRILWAYVTSGFLTGSAWSGDAVFAVEGKNGINTDMLLVRLDAETGAVVWKRDMPIKLDLAMAGLSRSVVDFYHVQIEFLGNRLVIVSKGIVIVDPGTGEPVGNVAFSVQTGVATTQVASTGVLGTAGALLASATRIGEVTPDLVELKGLVHVFDIEGNLYAVSLDSGKLLWKTKFDRISRVVRDPATDTILVSTGLPMITGIGKPIRDGKPGLVTVDALTGKITASIDTGWVVGTADDGSGSGVWFFNEKSALLVRNLKVERTIDFAKANGVDGIFAVYPLDEGKRTLVFGKNAAIFFDPMTGTTGATIQLGGPFGGIELIQRAGRYLAVELAPPGTLNFQNYRLLSIDLETGSVLNELITGSFSDGRKITMLEYLAFPKYGLFVRQEMQGKALLLNAYSMFPEGAFEPPAAVIASAAALEESSTAGVAAVVDSGSGPLAVSAPEGSVEVAASTRPDGMTPSTAIPLEFKKIKLDGKLDSWAGLEPLTAAEPFVTPFIGSTDYTFKQMFACIDDKFLYWRLDYVAANPQKKVPTGTTGKIFSQLLITYDSDNMITCGTNYRPEQSELKPYLSIWNIPKGTGTQIESTTFNVIASKQMLTGRIPLSVIKKYCKGPVQINGNAGYLPTSGKKSGTSTPTVYILALP